MGNNTHTNGNNLIKDATVEKQITPINSEDIKKRLGWCITDDDPAAILDNVKKELDKTKHHKVSSDSIVYKALSLLEFDKAILMTGSIPDGYRTFAIDFNRNIQKEYYCETPSEKATAELVALNFIRTLDIQRRINNLLEVGHVTDNLVRHFAILSKELDRANRHYLNALQTLKMLKHPALEVNIKTQTAIVGQNQVVQANNK